MEIRIGGEATGRRAHLGYCGNVHPGESLAALGDALDAAAAVRAELGWERLGFGLWLSRSALSELAGEDGVARLRDSLEEGGLEVVTANGFPYGNFHADVVKRAVYHPDWTTAERLRYTVELAEVLAALVPDGIDDATLSTLPLGHRDEGDEDVPERAADALCKLALELGRVREKSGVAVRVGLEPEPGCWLETTADVARFFHGPLAAAARRAGLNLDVVRSHVGACFDACHQAVAFEEPAAAVANLVDAGVPIVKVQLSSALELGDPGDDDARRELEAFAEPRFLHQVRTLDAKGVVTGVDNLDRAAELGTGAPWRVHFHVPIHRAAFSRLGTTRNFLAAVVPALAALDPAPHFEVETYTWSVLPEAERPRDRAGLVRGLARELEWARDALETSS